MEVEVGVSDWTQKAVGFIPGQPNGPAASVCVAGGMQAWCVRTLELPINVKGHEQVRELRLLITIGVLNLSCPRGWPADTLIHFF